jgi:hypothetical protein
LSPQQQLSQQHQVPQTLPQQYVPSQQQLSTQQPVPNPQISVQQPVYTSQAPLVVSTVMTLAMPGMGVKQQQGAVVEQQQIIGKGTGVEQGVNAALMQGSQILQGSSSPDGPSDVRVDKSGLRVFLKRQLPLKFVEDVV